MTFKHEYLGVFKADPRYDALYDALLNYYNSAEHSTSAEARTMYARFRKWCSDNGYTQTEINNMKRQIR